MVLIFRFLLLFFSAPPQGEVYIRGRLAEPAIVGCGQGACLSPLLRGWWPGVVVAPPVRVHVLVVQITFLLFAVVTRVVLSVVWVGARVAPLHEHELPVVQELSRPREVCIMSPKSATSLLFCLATD